jgi:hypothetical protein
MWLSCAGAGRLPALAQGTALVTPRRGGLGPFLIQMPTHEKTAAGGQRRLLSRAAFDQPEGQSHTGRFGLLKSCRSKTRERRALIITGGKAERRAENEGQVVTDEDLKLIRQIVAGGGRKYTAGNIDRSRYDRLVDMGWLIPFKINISDVEYQVTDEGRAAAAIEAR